jgi:hypothetical protein
LKAKPLEIPLVLQTAYAELLDKGPSAHPVGFAQKGTFVAKTVRGRRYWYFQDPTDQGRAQRYVGPETPALLERIARHKLVRDGHDDLRTLVATLARSAVLPRPSQPCGDIVAALADAGVFRLHGVLVGTMAYQTYSAMLGERLPATLMQTDEVDVAHIADTSVAADDTMPSIITALKHADPSFRLVPHRRGRPHVASYKATNGPRVNFLTPVRGPAINRPLGLHAFNVDAQPHRFLDFLIRDPEQAVLLHGTGVHVVVPAPERYVLHKLIVARRVVGAVKAERDIRQAGALLDVLLRKRPHELRAAWQEVYARGPAWRRPLGEGLGQIHPEIRERMLKLVEVTRAIIPGLDLQFESPAAGYDRDRDTVVFFGKAGTDSVRCGVNRAVLVAHAGDDGLDRAGCLRTFREHRPIFERIARAKYLTWPIEETGSVRIGMLDVGKVGGSAERSVAMCP